MPDSDQVVWQSISRQSSMSPWGKLAIDEGLIRSSDSARRIPAQWWLQGDSALEQRVVTESVIPSNPSEPSAPDEIYLWVANSEVSPDDVSEIPPVIQEALTRKSWVVVVQSAMEISPWQESNQPAASSLVTSRQIQPMNPQPRRASASFTFGYNRPLAVRRCGDVLSSIALINRVIFDNSDLEETSAISPRLVLVGGSGTAAYSLPAAVIAGPLVDDAMIATNRFRFGDLRHQDDAQFVPGMIKYGDIDAWAAARAPYDLTIVDDVPGQWPTAERIYAEHDATGQFNYSNFLSNQPDPETHP